MLLGHDLLQQHLEATRRQNTTVEVAQINPVVAGQVSLYLVAVLIEQVPEAA